MSMPIQRQSEAFGIFDDGPRFARDRASTDLPKGLAGLINTTGPRIQAGLLNTRTAADGCEYCGKPGHDWKIHPEAHRDIADWEREKHALEFPFGDYTEGVYPSEDDHGGEAWPGHQAARLAVNIEGMDPDSHAYHQESYGGPYDAGGHWVGDEDGYRSPRREWNPDFGYEMTDEDERNYEGVAEDDDSGYNWGPDPSDQLHPGDFRHSNSAEPFDSPTYNPRSAPYDNITGSRHPFDRAAAWRLADKDSECTCWDGYERVPGTEPCASGSCRKKSSLERLALPTDWSRVRPGPLIDTPLFEQDPEDPFKVRPHNGPHCPDCDRPVRWVSDPGCDHTELFDRHYGHVSPSAARTALAAPAEAPAQVPQGGGYQIGHQVALAWRPGSNINGTVIGVNGPDVHVRWEDGQYSTEEPRNINLR